MTSTTVTVNTVLFIAGEHYYGLGRNIHDDIRVGTSTTDVTLNTICKSTLNLTGWYQCPNSLIG